MTNFKNVKIGERFYFNGFEYIKTFNSENGKEGAVSGNGAYMTDCEKWLVELVELPIKSPKEKKTDHKIVIFVFELSDPIIMRITEEQKRIIEVLHDYDIIANDIEVSFKDDTFIIDATKE